MVNLNTLRVLAFTPLVWALSLVPAQAQSVLHFPYVAQSAGAGARFEISNGSTEAAEVDFTLYSLDGSVVPGLVKPVRYTIEPGGALSMSAGEVFAADALDGWVRVTSPSSGIHGVYFSGDFEARLDGVRGSEASFDQVVLIPSGGSSADRSLRLVNPSSRFVSADITVFNRAGEAVYASQANLGPNEGAEIALGPLGDLALAARVTSSEPVVAQSAVRTVDSVMLVAGRPASAPGVTSLVAPHVIIGSGFDSTLVLANPTSDAVTVFATVFDQDGGPVSPALASPVRRALTIPANGLVSASAASLTGLLFSPPANGWIQVETPTAALAGVLVVSGGGGSTSYPLQDDQLGSMSYVRPVDAGGTFLSLALTNPSPSTAQVELTLVGDDGVALIQQLVEVGPSSKHLVLLGDLVGSAARGQGTLHLTSSVPLFSVAFIDDAGGAFLAAVEPRQGPAVFAAAIPAVDGPRLTQVEPRQVRPGEIIQIRTSGAATDSVLLLAGQPVEDRLLSPFGSIRALEVPDLGPGFVDLVVRTSDGLESAPESILILSADLTPLVEVQGRAFYEKVLVTEAGLAGAPTVMIPIRAARIEVFDQVTGSVFTSTSTDYRGNFQTVAPAGANYGVRVLSHSDVWGVTVADNTRGGGVYLEAMALDPELPALLVATDLDRVSGAFNILEVVRRGDVFLNTLDPRLPLPELTIFWSPLNTSVRGNVTQGQIGGTFFSVSDGTAFVLGDRSTDSDEFDDAVLLHEYAHLLAARFSRDDSRGGEHVLGDVLDPRVAWSEGWANFFSAAVRDESMYRDSYGVGGANVLEYDLEENVPPGDQPGYWSEFSVHSMLWDFLDDDVEDGDTVEIPLAAIWSAFRGLADAVPFVYSPTYLERLVAIEAIDIAAVEQIARQRSIDFASSADPTVSNPFPRLVTGAGSVVGEVDSLTRRRNNLAQSVHLYSFDVAGGAVSLRLDVTGLGPGGSTGANDLDLFLLDGAGQVVGRSDRGLNGQSELISTFLPAGRYFVEIRSFYTTAETGDLVFNSGAYRLTIRLP